MIDYRRGWFWCAYLYNYLAVGLIAASPVLYDGAVFWVMLTLNCVMLALGASILKNEVEIAKLEANDWDPRECIRTLHEQWLEETERRFFEGNSGGPQWSN